MKGKYNEPEWIGKKINMLTIIEPVRKSTNGISTQWVWKAKCDCGNEKIVMPAEVIKKKVISCGCYRKHKPCPTKTHGESHTKLHNIWCGINNRCDPNHMHSERYGKRGICVCDEWKDYEKFAAWARSNGFSDGLTIERIDVNGNYCPENCKWIPLEKQARNRRTTHWVEYNGKKMSLAEACEIAGLPYKQVFWRMKNMGWSFEKAISTPMGSNYGKTEFPHVCSICGKQFTSHSCRSKYCSHECYIIYRSKKRHHEF